MTGKTATGRHNESSVEPRFFSSDPAIVIVPNRIAADCVAMNAERICFDLIAGAAIRKDDPHQEIAYHLL